MVGPQMRRVLQEHFRDTARRLGASLRIAVSDDLIKPGDQGRGDCHPSAQTALVALDRV
jgi:hypothetical protein